MHMQVASLHGCLGLAEKSLNGASESQRAKDITRPTVVRSLVSFSKTFGSTTTICGGWQPLTIPKHCAVLAGTCNCLERESLQDPYTYVLIIYMYIYIYMYICIHTRSSVLCQCCQDCSQALTPEGPEAGPNLEAGAGQKYHVASRRRRECDIQHRELLHSCFVWFWYILAVLVELHFVKS